MQFYDNLLQVCIRNQSVIYNLDHPTSQEEVNFIFNTGQFTKMDQYVNSGFFNTVSYENEDDWDKFVQQDSVFANEMNNLVYSKE